MNWNDHSKLNGVHSVLSPSKYSWINYDAEKRADFIANMNASREGTALHSLAEHCIRMRQKLPKNQKTLNLYVNDAVQFHMKPEQVLYFSDNCFGTADSICFRDNFLRIHDLKTGKTEAHMEQLLIYAAIFCLEYQKNPGDIGMELRIYQSDEVLCYTPTPDEISAIMQTIIEFDKQIEESRMEGDLA